MKRQNNQWQPPVKLQILDWAKKQKKSFAINEMPIFGDLRNQKRVLAELALSGSLTRKKCQCGMGFVYSYVRRLNS